MSTLIVPQSHPFTYTEKKIPRIPREIGTGLTGRDNDSGPSTHMIAADNAVLVILIVAIFDFAFIVKFSNQVYNFKNVVYNAFKSQSIKFTQKFTIQT